MNADWRRICLRNLRLCIILAAIGEVMKVIFLKLLRLDLA